MKVSLFQASSEKWLSVYDCLSTDDIDAFADRIRDVYEDTWKHFDKWVDSHISRIYALENEADNILASEGETEKYQQCVSEISAIHTERENLFRSISNAHPCNGLLFGTIVALKSYDSNSNASIHIITLTKLGLKLVLRDLYEPPCSIFEGEEFRRKFDEACRKTLASLAMLCYFGVAIGNGETPVYPFSKKFQ